MGRAAQLAALILVEIQNGTDNPKGGYIMALYKGFSSFEFQKNKTFKLNDIELVKMDLLNHIYTKRGSRVMMPRFGTVIPELVFEPLDEETLEILRDEILYVINYDPRVSLINFNLVPDYDNNTILVTADLRYVELNLVDTFELRLEFEAQQ